LCKRVNRISSSPDAKDVCPFAGRRNPPTCRTLHNNWFLTNTYMYPVIGIAPSVFLGGGGRGCCQTRFLRHGLKPGRVLQCSVLQTRFELRTICKPTLQMISVVLPHRSEELTHTLLTIQSKDFSGGGGLVAASITSGRLVAASTLTIGSAQKLQELTLPRKPPQHVWARTHMCIHVQRACAQSRVHLIYLDVGRSAMPCMRAS
jgi:hypothetical protein